MYGKVKDTTKAMMMSWSKSVKRGSVVIPLRKKCVRVLVIVQLFNN